MSERTATEQLMDTVRELVYDGAQESVVAILEQQIAINTRVEQENRALREFVALVDSNISLVVEQPNWCDIGEDDWELDGVFGELIAARQRLAAEHGLPLPGAGDGA